MSVISRLKVWLTADTKEFSDRLNKGKKEVSGFSSAMKKVGGVIAGAFALSSITSFIKECKSLWKIQEKAENKLESVIKATGGAAELTADQMKKYASSLQDATTYGDEVTIDAMSIMATFKSIKGDVFKEAIKSAQDMAYVMNTDLNQAALQLGKALESPELGLTALRRSGVSFSTEQIKQIKQLVAEGKKQEAQLIMLKELQTEFGGAAANAANTATGATAQLSNAWGDFKETVGKAITPSISIIQFLTKAIQTQTAVLADGAIPIWKKFFGILSPLQGSKNIVDALNNMRLNEVNDKEIESLKLYSLEYRELIELYAEYARKNKQSAGVYKQTSAAILQEIRARESGIASMTEQEKKMGELHKMSERSIKDVDDKIYAYKGLYESIDKNDKSFSSAIQEEIFRLKKSKDAIKSLEIQEIAGMSEQGYEAVNNKIKAYKNLVNAVGMVDQASEINYTREINRLETLIAENKKLVNAKLRQEVDVPIVKAQSSLGVEGALIDNTPYLSAFQKIVDLPKILKPAKGQLKDLTVDMLDISNEISGAFAGMAEGVGESIGELIAGGGSMAGFTKLVGGAFADMAIQVGKIAIGVGMATEAIKASLAKLGGLGAIAAGVALVALGTAAKSALSSVANSGGGTFSSNAYSNELDVRTKNNSLDRVSRSVDVNVSGEFKLQGNTLVAAINKENRRKNLTT